MKKLLLTLVLGITTLGSLSSQSLNPFIDYVNGLTDPTAQQTAVDSFLTIIEPQGIPWAENDTLVHFLYQGTATEVAVAGDFNSWNPNVDALSPLGETDLWYASHTFEANARLDYKLVIGSNWILDPLNPNTIAGGFGPNSELAMPAYVQPWEIEDTGAMPAGTLQSGTIASTNTGKTYSYQVYLPGEYAEHPERYYPAIYVHDGFEYLSLAQSKNILDNLIAQELISPLIAVFIHPTNRNEEYAGNMRTQYRKFVAEEMVDHIQGQYRARNEAEQRATIGTSFGGNISGLISYYHPDVFGKAGLHSAAFWPNNYETYHLLNDNPAQDVQYAFVWGTYEGSLHSNLLDLTPAMADKGYELYTNYYPEGHSWGLWRATLDEMLIYLFPPGATTGTSENQPVAWRLFPNPATDSFQLFAPNLEGQSLQLELRAISGEIIRQQAVFSGTTLSLPADLSRGIYFVHLKRNGESLGIRRIVVQ